MSLWELMDDYPGDEVSDVVRIVCHLEAFDYGKERGVRHKHACINSLIECNITRHFILLSA